MSIRFRDARGVETVVSGLTPGGDLELGVTGQRTGTVTTEAIAAGGLINQEITFAEPFVREFDYEVVLHCSSGFYTGLVKDKTVNGFTVEIINASASSNTCTVDYNAFVLLNADRMNLLETEIESVSNGLANKQDKLTFDNKPTADSTNPVTSTGIKAAIDEVTTIANSSCNPNLLDNAWFNVNQRAQSSYTENAVYCFDRWKNYLEGGEVKRINSNTYTGVIVKSAGEWGNLSQRIVSEYMEPLIGKKLVMSAIVKSDIDTTIRMRFGYRNSSGMMNAGTIIYEVNVPANTKTLIQSPPTVLDAIAQTYNGFGFMFYPQRTTDTTRANVTVYATKLEISEAGSTLENETAPPRPVELAKCQRYFYRYSVNASGHATYIPAQLYSNTLALCMLPIPTTMRAAPTLTISDDVTSSSSLFRFAYGDTSGATLVQLTQLTFYSITPGGIIVQLNMASDAGIDATKNNGFLRIANNNGYMDFSAEN